MATLYYYKYNNYYNRRYKKENSLTNYAPYLVYTETSINFNLGDGVNTQIVGGRDGNAYFSNADYIIYSTDNTSITSRWFIIESNYNRGGQYVMNLQRDLVADFYNDILTADTYIERAILTDNDPLIYNKENITVNQIKKAEYTIKDNTKCAWLVGYLDRKYSTPTDKPLKFEGTLIPDEIIDAATINDWTLYKKYNSTYCKLFLTSDEGTRQWLEIPFARQYGDRSLFYEYSVSGPTTSSNNQYLKTWTTEIGNKSLTSTSFLCFEKSNLNDDAYLSALRDYLSGIFPIQTFEDNVNSMITDAQTYNKTDYTSILSYVGKLIRTNDGKTYKISVDTVNDYKAEYNYIEDTLYNSLNQIFQNWGTVISGTLKYKLIRYSTAIKIIATEVSGGKYQTTIPSSRYHLKDAPYDIFIMPYGDNIVWKNTGDFNVAVDKFKAIGMAQGIAAELGTNLYDIQLLPYCPTEAFVCTTTNDITTIDINASDDKNVRRTLIYSEGTTNVVGAMCWITASSGNKIIDFSIVPGNKKITNECTLWRLVSPNYNGQFEFNPVKNNNRVHNFVINYTYLPYQPFIRIAPDFAGLYGKEFKDARGLICQGDFSISYMSDRWAEYQIQNKNYNNIFDREIQNMEVTNEVNYRRSVVNAITGTVAGAAAGAYAGKAAGVGGAIAGGIIGGGATLAAGLVDIADTKRLQEETLNYKTDIFNLQLDNVKALPNSITKVTAYTEINKVFPILEYYKCTDEEENAVANKIAWNSMTVGVISTIQNYVGNTWVHGNIIDKGYIKGKIIRFESDLADDMHIVAAIADEINKGWYFK